MTRSSESNRMMPSSILFSADLIALLVTIRHPRLLAHHQVQQANQKPVNQSTWPQMALQTPVVKCFQHPTSLELLQACRQFQEVYPTMLHCFWIQMSCRQCRSHRINMQLVCSTTRSAHSYRPRHICPHSRGTRCNNSSSLSS